MAMASLNVSSLYVSCPLYLPGRVRVLIGPLRQQGDTVDDVPSLWEERMAAQRSIARTLSSWIDCRYFSARSDRFPSPRHVLAGSELPVGQFNRAAAAVA